MKKRTLVIGLIAALTAGSLAGCGNNNTDEKETAAASSSVTAASSKEEAPQEKIELTNVSYDPTRELYKEYNSLFQEYWKETTGGEIEITQSHGGSGKQALEVANGLEADVVTLALEGDVDAVKDAGLIEEGYTEEFELDSSPYTSTIVFLVRSGNPKNILDWDDLLREDVGVITPNPKTSGGARWNYLAAWYYFEQQGLEEDAIKEQLKTLYENVVVLDSGARGSTTSFVENKQGDVLIAWENEAFLSLEEHPGEYEIVVPSVSILCQPTVAIVDEVVDKRGTREAATEYLSYLYSDEAQELEAKWYYRPSNQDILNQFVYEEDSNVITELPEDSHWIVTSLDLTDINHFNGWTEAGEKHFSDGGLFDEIYEE